MYREHVATRNVLFIAVLIAVPFSTGLTKTHYYEKFTKLKPLQCGLTQNPSFEQFSFNVSRAPGPLEIPWLVTITKGSTHSISPRQQARYLGVILSRRWILTAASFVLEERPENVQVWPAVFEDDQEHLVVDTIIAHPGYTSSSVWREHNLALIKLNKSLEFEDTGLGTICLPEIASRDLSANVTFGVGLPWRRPMDSPFGGLKMFTANQIEAADDMTLLVNVSMCEYWRAGDPLVAIRFEPKVNRFRFVLIGLYSSFKTCYDDELMGTEYLRVSSVSEWIYKSMVHKTKTFYPKKKSLTSRATGHCMSVVRASIVSIIILLICY